MPTWLSTTCRVLIIVLFPIVLTLTNVRLLLTPWFPEIEYRLPGFPDDRYGFTQAERLQGSKIAIDYLLNDQGIEFLGELRFPEGQGAPPESCEYYVTRDCTFMYNDRELRHMEDVKVVTRGALTVWWISGLVGVLCVGALAYYGEIAALRAGLLGGAGLTLVLLLSIIVYVLIGFDIFFVQFHKVFFEGDSWLFLWSDTLIRYFPERFWQDAFLFIGGGAVLEAVLIGGVAWWRL